MSSELSWPEPCTYTVYTRYFWLALRQIYGHIRRTYTVLANLTCERFEEGSIEAFKPIRSMHCRGSGALLTFCDCEEHSVEGEAPIL